MNHLRKQSSISSQQKRLHNKDQTCALALKIWRMRLRFSSKLTPPLGGIALSACFCSCARAAPCQSFPPNLKYCSHRVVLQTGLGRMLIATSIFEYQYAMRVRLYGDRS
eukprot:2472979-Rhodomonas_salina.1